MTEEAEPTPDEARALYTIAKLSDPSDLRNMRDNARNAGSAVVEKAAFRRLVEVLPYEDDTPLSRDFWRSIHSLEESLTTERKKTTRLSRTRQKLARVGVNQTLSDLVNAAKPSDGFHLLRERGMGDLLAEAVVIRHATEFSAITVETARNRLREYDITIPE